MSPIKAFISRHPVLTYYALSFAISWGGLLVVFAPGGIPHTKEQFQTLLPLAIPAMLGGPAAAGILLIGLMYGTPGFRELLSRMRRWRVAVRWYAVALLTAPIVLTAIYVALSLTSPVFTPGIFATDDKASLLLFGIVAGLAVGFFEELGWTGFAIPTLMRRHGILTTGLVAGVLWGVWHIPAHVVLASGSYSGTLEVPVFMSARIIGFLIGSLPAFRVLMVWVYDRTGSLLVAMLMHMSLTATTLIVEPLGISGVALLISDLVTLAVLWGIVAAVAVAGRFRHVRSVRLQADLAKSG